MKLSTALLTVALAAAIGYLTGVLGTVIQHHNESKFGSSYSRFSYEWFAVPSLPGMLITEHQIDHDLQIDELWTFRGSVRRWNTVAYGMSTLVLMAFIGGARSIWTRRHQQNGCRQRLAWHQSCHRRFPLAGA